MDTIKKGQRVSGKAGTSQHQGTQERSKSPEEGQVIPNARTAGRLGGRGVGMSH